MFSMLNIITMEYLTLRLLIGLDAKMEGKKSAERNQILRQRSGMEHETGRPLSMRKAYFSGRGG